MTDVKLITSGFVKSATVIVKNVNKNIACGNECVGDRVSGDDGSDVNHDDEEERGGDDRNGVRRNFKK